MTPLQKGEDLAKKVMKRKGEIDSLALQLNTMPFGASLMKEMETFSAQLEPDPHTNVSVCISQVTLHLLAEADQPRLRH